jgi:hypothetical protein
MENVRVVRFFYEWHSSMVVALMLLMSKKCAQGAWHQVPKRGRVGRYHEE